MSLQHRTSLIKLLAVIAAICLLFASCGKSSGNNSSYNDFNNQNNSISDESNSTENTIKNNEADDSGKESTIPLKITLDSDGFVPLNSDGVVQLSSYSETADNLVYACSRYGENDKTFFVLYKHADEHIPKIKINADIGIYENKEEINLYSIKGVAPKYTIPLNFHALSGAYVDDESVDVSPEYFHLSKYVNFAYNLQATDLEECNGEDIKTYVNSRSNIFHETHTPYHEYKLIDAEKNEEFTFGFYKGTAWEEFTVKAIVEYYEVDAAKPPISVPIERTKNGYFKVDFSNLKAGLYYVPTYNSFIELV